MILQIFDSLAPFPNSEYSLFLLQIMYRPPRDLTGIPGAKSLILCLTGYQRQDRDEIMVCRFQLSFFLQDLNSCFSISSYATLLIDSFFFFQIMVGLMGANFSKPLVANKVTHLICYKFEGKLISHVAACNTFSPCFLSSFFSTVYSCRS